MKPKRSTAFYIEALVLVLFFLGMLGVLVQLFAAARHTSRQAAQLNDAVCAARNLAECFSAADSAADFCSRAGLEQATGSLRVDAQGQPSATGEYLAALRYTAAPPMAQLDIQIQTAGGQPLYSLSCEKYLP